MLRCRLETNGARTAHARLGEFLQKNHSVLSGLFLFTLISVIQTIRTGHFSTGVNYVFPIGEEDSKVSAATLVNSEADVYVEAPLAAFSDNVAEDSGTYSLVCCYSLYQTVSCPLRIYGAESADATNSTYP